MKALNFQEYIKQSPKGKAVEIEREVFDYFLEVLPPVSMNKTIKMPDGRMQKTSFEFAEGWEETTAFWKDNNRYYAQKTGHMNLRAFG